MPLDTRIPLMAAQPRRNNLTDSYVQAMQLKGMQQQMAAQDAAQQRETQRANLLRQFGGDLEGAAGAALSAGDLDTGLQLERVVSGRKKSERDERMAAIKDRMDLFAREGALLSRVTSPEDYTAILSMAPEVGVDTAMWPKPDDPELMTKVKAAVMATMDPKAREELAIKAADAEWKRKRDEQKLGLDERRTAAYERGASQTNINMPGQLAARPLTPEEVQQFGIPPDKAGFLMIDAKGDLAERPLAPGEKKAGDAEVSARTEAASNAKAWDVYSRARQGLESSLSATPTGPIAGRIPALTTEAQISDAAIAAMAPTLKQLFRSAGEGVFTDKDQELLMAMIPTRQQHPEARRAILQNIDAIIRSKLGITQESASEPKVGDVVDGYRYKGGPPASPSSWESP